MRLRGTIRHRLLLTYRVDPEWLRRSLPPGFAPTVVDGAALGGLCLLAWQGLGPDWAPRGAGLDAVGVAERWFAHRVGRRHVPGLVIPRRWMHGRAATWATRRVAGGHVRPATVAFLRHGSELRVRCRGAEMEVDAAVQPATEHPAGAVHGGDRAALDALHATATRGWTVCGNGHVAATDLEVVVPWRATPARPVEVTQDVLPAHAELDHALVMQDLPAIVRPVDEVVGGGRGQAPPTERTARMEVRHG